MSSQIPQTLLGLPVVLMSPEQEASYRDAIDELVLDPVRIVTPEQEARAINIEIDKFVLSATIPMTPSQPSAQCIAMVPDPGTFSAHQCKRKAIDGEFCLQHMRLAKGTAIQPIPERTSYWIRTTAVPARAGKAAHVTASAYGHRCEFPWDATLGEHNHAAAAMKLLLEGLPGYSSMPKAKWKIHRGTADHKRMIEFVPAPKEPAP